MAGAAILRGMGQHWIMSLMARCAEFSGIVLIGNDLRKTSRTGRGVIVADGAFAAVTRDLRLDFRRVLDMSFGRSVTNFAGDIFVVRLCLKIIDIIVALDTGFRPCVLRPFFLDFVDRFRTVMSVQAKGGRYERSTGNDENSQNDREQNAEADDLLWDSRKFQLKLQLSKLYAVIIFSYDLF